MSISRLTSVFQVTGRRAVQRQQWRAFKFPRARSRQLVRKKIRKQMYRDALLFETC